MKKHIVLLFNKKVIMEIKTHVRNVIDATFKVIQDVYENQRENGITRSDNPQSRILFPLKRDRESIRVSEQEMRFIFVEQLYKEIKNGWDVYYSVETPTLDTYNFKEEPKQDPDGQSANVDLVIFNNQFRRIALIEFKANNPKVHDYKKDFVKLNNKEEGEFVERFFIEIIKNDDKEPSIIFKGRFQDMRPSSDVGL